MNIFDKPITCIPCGHSFCEKCVGDFNKKHKIGNAEIDLNKMTITIKGDQKKIKISEKLFLVKVLHVFGYI